MEWRLQDSHVQIRLFAKMPVNARVRTDTQRAIFRRLWLEGVAYAVIISR